MKNRIKAMADSRDTLLALDEINGFKVRPGLYDVNGATALPNGVNFTIHSHQATGITLLLYKIGEKEPYARVPFPDNYKIGKVYSMLVFGLDIRKFEYAYSVDGPFDPSRGLIFDKNKPLLDPYARAVSGQSVWGEHLGVNDAYHANVVKNNFDWGDSIQPLLPMENLIIYELHVRGFTRHHSSKVAYPGTFAGLMEKIPYIKSLGVTAVELMPIFEFDEMSGIRVEDGRELLDYWGYNTVSFFAPNTSYTAETESNEEGKELKNLIKQFHDNGIEVILDVVFNHTAEGNEKGPFFSFKGFDNNIYYMLTPEGYYYNFSGCGNTLNCNHPIVQQLILESLRYWVTSYRVDGFRFDLASILGRNEDGSPMNNPPLLKNLAFDSVLGNVKLIAEAWDAGGLYQVGQFPAWNRWAEWNGKYRDDLKSFLKGGFYAASDAAKRITGSPDLYTGQYKGYNSSVNFLTCHDGFTLYDLYSYNTKHNEANGWKNTDGSDDNRSWNCGAEGETEDPEVMGLRMRLIKNACAVLMCSRGTPMFLAGDEFCNTQFGNNNSYCQDNEISWLDWSRLEKNQEIFRFFQYMIAFRKQHVSILGGSLPGRIGLPPISIHTQIPWDSNFNEETPVICVLYTSRTRDGNSEDIVYLATNVHWEAREIRLPKLPEGWNWHLAVNTGADTPSKCYGEEVQILPDRLESFTLFSRSVAVFTGQREDIV